MKTKLESAYSFKLKYSKITVCTVVLKFAQVLKWSPTFPNISVQSCFEKLVSYVMTILFKRKV